MNKIGIVALAAGILATPVVVNQANGFTEKNEAHAQACISMSTAKAECAKVNRAALANSNEELHEIFVRMNPSTVTTYQEVAASTPEWLHLW